MFYVYELRDENGLPFYVGKGSKRRMHEHENRARRGIKSHLCAKIRKLGYTIRKAIVFRSSDEQAAFAEEMRLIAYYGREVLCNQTDGGDGSINPTAETRAKISAARRGIVASEATRNRQRLAHIGKRHTEATRAKISAKQRTVKKPWAVNSVRNLGNGFKGHTWSVSHRKKFLSKRVGHIVTQETRDKISASKIKSHERRKQKRH